MSMRLVDGLRADKQSRIAFVGAGGKTSAMFSLARQLSGQVICINTSHLAVEQVQLADRHMVINHPGEVDTAISSIVENVILLTGPVDERGRLRGLPELTAEAIFKTADRLGLPVLVEADGSRLRPLKAPAAHEPPIPAWIKHVVVTVGLSGLGKPMDDDHVFRPEIFASISGAKLGRPVALEHLIKVAINPQGGLKNIPAHARKTLLANQLDTYSASESDLISVLGTCLPAYDSILLGSVRNPPPGQVAWRHEAVGGVILAAGASLRMGEVKQLLPWRGKPLVRHVAETAISAGLNPVVVVTGAAADRVEAALTGLSVVIALNEQWESGQASSVRSGIQTLPDSCGAAVFLLSDMPQVNPDLITAELDLHSRESDPIIVPRVQGQRTNPVLFDRVTFADLAALSGDTGGRALFDRFPVRWLDRDYGTQPADIDTPADYQRLMEETDDG